MKKILVPLADGFEEIETTTIVDILRRAGLEVTVAGLKAGAATGSRRMKVIPDATLDEVRNQEFDAVVLPGGQPGADNLRKDSRVLDILKQMNQKKKVIGAICAAPLVVRDAGLLSGIKMTGYPAYEKEFKEGRYQEQSVVMDGNIVTSRGPATAMEFALKLVESLAGSQKAKEIAGDLLVKA